MGHLKEFTEKYINTYCQNYTEKEKTITRNSIFVGYEFYKQEIIEEIRISDIDFKTTELLEIISVNDKIYACEGYNEKGHKYTGIAEVSCGEIINVTQIKIA